MIVAKNQFYSTKKKGDVLIPTDKVCGYRIKNDWTKKGYSNGIKAGKDNGVVDQKLSRFATSAESESSKSKCAGSTNWFNHRTGENFNKNKVDDPKNKAFSLNRPSSNSGRDLAPQYADDVSKMRIDNINKRFGNVYGNKVLTRPAFEAPEVLARQAVDFNKLQALDIDKFGAKVQLSDETLKKLFDVKLPDPQDLEFIEEKAHLTDLLTDQGFTPEQIELKLKTNKPLGRDQRTINSRKNIATSGLSLDNKLKEIKEEIKDGRAESRVQQGNILGQIALILGSTKAVEQLTNIQLAGLGAALNRLGAPRTYKQVGLIPRYVDSTFYDDNSGAINMLLLTNALANPTPGDNNYNGNYPVKNFMPKSRKAHIKLSSALTTMKNAPAFLDLQRLGIIDQTQLRAEAQALGGYTADFDIKPALQ